MKKRLIKIFGGIIIFLIAFHIALPFILVNYVNKTLKDIPGFTGSVEWIHVNLFRGAYTIHTIDLSKISHQNEEEPFFAAKTIDLSVEWKALLKGQIVGEIILDRPELIFKAEAPESNEKVDTVEVTDTDWTEPIKALMPLQINRFEILNGEIHFKDRYADPKVDIYFKDMQALVSNLNNASSNTEELPSPFSITASSIGEGKLTIDGGLNILKEVPDFDVNLSFEEVELESLNTFLLAYANADVDKGTLNFYTEVAARDGNLKGYLKPLLTDLKFVNWQQDKDQPLKLVWESVIGFVAEITENQKKDQFATKVPIDGSFEDVETGVLSAVGKIFKNAFFEAFKKEVDNSIQGLDLEEKKQDDNGGLFGLFDKDKND